jgi:hypothetical protein
VIANQINEQVEIDRRLLVLEDDVRSIVIQAMKGEHGREIELMLLDDMPKVLMLFSAAMDRILMMEEG